MNQYFIPIAIGACGLALCLTLSLFALISKLEHRGGGRRFASEQTDETIKPGDTRRLYDWGTERNRTYPH